LILLDKPLFSEEHEPGSWRPPAGAAYLYSVTTEDRSEQVVSFKGDYPETMYFELRESDGEAFESDVTDYEYVPVRDASGIASFLGALGCSDIIIDITGLTHIVWVPLVKMALESSLSLTVVYFEPREYALNSTPRLGEFYDLSDKTEGIGPLPLMVNLQGDEDSNIVYVPLLGFEGQRSAFMLEQVNPDARTYPIIGLPGFKLEYPFESLLGNSQMLLETKAHRDARYAKSNCPFSLFYQLERVRERHPHDLIRIGLTGTKPHALGAVLFAIIQGNRVELVYDYVRRKAGRSLGADRCVVYRISDFLSR
jgi:hypothetical protein